MKLKRQLWLIVFDMSEGDAEHDAALDIIKEICTRAEVDVTIFTHNVLNIDGAPSCNASGAPKGRGANRKDEHRGDNSPYEPRTFHGVSSRIHAFICLAAHYLLYIKTYPNSTAFAVPSPSGWACL